MEAKTMELLREWDMTEQVYRGLLISPRILMTVRQRRSWGFFDAIHEVRKQCINHTERFLKKMKI
ncbi:hypothetical protein PC110_g21934 [Phytophthora cactorum]|uniref:Uncharacterized protein n=1 Tax=Phytophthora cactorum TaxID=29920 RepID=A0A329RAP7_9STRA|nr:hypothetical protein PC110_g21934 [Phytophthora cactorum]